MSATSRRGSRPSSVSDEGLLLIGAVVVVVVGVGGLWTSMHLGHVWFGGPAPESNPVGLVVELVNGRTPWTSAATWAGLVQAGGVVALLLGATVVTARRRSGVNAPRRVDAADRHMGRGQAIAPLRRKHAAAVAARLGVTAAPGIRIGTTLRGAPLYRSWEDVMVTVAGPRTGKTSALVIPEILEAPGAVLATSNKRDVVDATRHVRAAPRPDGRARRVWVFDPQGLVDEPVSWWWNPLSYVTDEVKAAQLAEVFVSATQQPGARTDAYFTNAGRNLLANLLLAAALDDRPLGEVYDWLADPEDDTPAVLLSRYDKHRLAGALRGVMKAAPEQRSGVYGTAQEVAAFMTNSQAMRWVTPPEHQSHQPHQLHQSNQGVEFRPHEYVTTHDTLYSLSREGRGSAGPLVTALTVAVCEAAETAAALRPTGRLLTPIVVSLDEAANVCRWRELPDLYSHYGSRGIVMSTYLQSWSQGTEVWGRDGMRKLWSAANVSIYAGGVSEVEFLREVSQLIGEYRDPSRSVSTGKNGRSVTTGDSKSETILDVSDLATLERGRAVVFASGARPVLMRTEPWMSGPRADEVRASIGASTYAAQPSQPSGLGLPGHPNRLDTPTPCEPPEKSPVSGDPGSVHDVRGTALRWVRMALVPRRTANEAESRRAESP